MNIFRGDLSDISAKTATLLHTVADAMFIIAYCQQWIQSHWCVGSVPWNVLKCYYCTAYAFEQGLLFSSCKQWLSSLVLYQAVELHSSCYPITMKCFMLFAIVWAMIGKHTNHPWCIQGLFRKSPRMLLSILMSLLSILLAIESNIYRI